jgi:hypothetical protein
MMGLSLDFEAMVQRLYRYQRGSTTDQIKCLACDIRNALNNASNLPNSGNLNVIFTPELYNAIARPRTPAALRRLAARTAVCFGAPAALTVEEGDCDEEEKEEELLLEDCEVVDSDTGLELELELLDVDTRFARLEVLFDDKEFFKEAVAVAVAVVVEFVSVAETVRPATDSRERITGWIVRALGPISNR